MEQGQGKGDIGAQDMRELIFEGLNWYIRPMETSASSDKKKKGKKKD